MVDINSILAGYVTGKKPVTSTTAPKPVTKPTLTTPASAALLPPKAPLTNTSANSTKPFFTPATGVGAGFGGGGGGSFGGQASAPVSAPTPLAPPKTGSGGIANFPSTTQAAKGTPNATTTVQSPPVMGPTAPAGGLAGTSGSSGATGATGAAGGASSSVSGASTGGSSFLQQYQALIDKYNAAVEAASQPGADEAATQQALNDIIAKQAALTASEQAGEAKVSNQPVEMGFVTGQNAALQRSLAAQMGTLSSQEVPLKDKLATEQAQRQAAMDVAEKEITAGKDMLGELKPTNIAYGGTLVDPTTGQTIAQGQSETATLAPGATLVDKATGQVIAQGQPKQTTMQAEYAQYQAQGGTGTLLDFMQQTKGASANLDPSDVQYIADAHAAAGTMPTAREFGYSAQGATNYAAVLHAMAQEGTGAGLISQKMLQTADAAALKANVTQQAAASVAEGRANYGLNLVSSLSKQVPRTDFSLLNNWIQTGKTQVYSDPKAQQLQNAIETATTEYAKVMSGGTGNTQPYVSALNKATGYLSAAMSAGTMDAAIQLMQTEMNGAMQAYGQTKQDITDRMATYGNQGGSTSSTDGGGTTPTTWANFG